MQNDKQKIAILENQMLRLIGEDGNEGVVGQLIEKISGIQKKLNLFLIIALFDSVVRAGDSSLIHKFIEVILK